MRPEAPVSRATTWKRNNKEKVSKRRSELYRADPAKADAAQKRWAEKNPFSVLATHLKMGMRSRARLHGVPFDAETFTHKFLVECLQAQPTCECCGRPWRVNVGGLKDSSPTLDRIHPRKGYVLGNVAILCWRCNYLKRDASLQELEVLVHWLRRVSHDDQG